MISVKSLSLLDVDISTDFLDNHIFQAPIYVSQTSISKSVFKLFVLRNHIILSAIWNE